MTISVKQFSNADELMAHSRRVAAMRYAPRPVPPKAPELPPAPVIDTVAALIARYVQIRTPVYAGNDEAFVSDVKPSPPMRAILRAVSEQFGISEIEILSARRWLPVILARQALMYLCREMTFQSFPAIGRFIGNRDHTTVLSGVKACGRRLEADPEYREHVEAVRARIQGHL